MSGSWQDQLRQAIRHAREAPGFPASADVGRLSKVIQQLQKPVESQLGDEISAASIAIPALVALYEEDLQMLSLMLACGP
jgi:hypothetical protein